VRGDGAFAVLHAFDGADGFRPSPLIERAPGIFYGKTAAGGQNGYGTVFKLDSHGAFVSLHSFKGSDGCGTDYDSSLVRGKDGSLYGTTYGCDLTAGTVFKLDDHDHVVPFYMFDAATEGANPLGLVSARDGALYGTTISGGAYGYGTVYRLDLHRRLTLLHSFEITRPTGPLIEGEDGAFYGALYSYQGDGVFRVGPNGSYTVLHYFDAAQDGGDPFGHESLIMGADGKLYGTAALDGPISGGTVYSLSPFLGGDANGDFILDVTDIFALLNFLFAGGTAPNPLLRADANGDGVVDVSDVFYLIQYLYAEGPPPA
jgi:uncharacterized repeat protein (TIGR03803 family)